MVLRPIFRHLYQSNFRTGDFSDKLNSTWTVLLLLVSSFLAWHETFEKEPLTCWVPAHVTIPISRYMHKICWESEKHYPMIEAVPGSLKNRKLFWRPVYKWLPLIIFLQALLFKVPDLILSAGQGCFGFKFKKIIGLTVGYSSLNMTERKVMAKQIGRYLQNWMRSSTIKSIPWGPLTVVYLFVKMLYVVNVVAQVSYLDGYLRVENETSYGQMLAKDIKNNETSKWRLIDTKFPKIVMCDIAARFLNNVHHYTIQCMFNSATFYEGLYGVIWVWLTFTVAVTCFSFVLHGVKVLVPIFRKRYVALHVKLSEDLCREPTDGEISQFVSSELNEDGIMILKAIGEVSSELLVQDIIIYLWTSRYQYPVMPINPPSALAHTEVYNPGMAEGRGVVIAPPPFQPNAVQGGSAPGEPIPLVTVKSHYH